MLGIKILVSHKHGGYLSFIENYVQRHFFFIGCHSEGLGGQRWMGTHEPEVISQSDTINLERIVNT